MLVCFLSNEPPSFHASIGSYDTKKSHNERENEIPSIRGSKTRNYYYERDEKEDWTNGNDDENLEMNDEEEEIDGVVKRVVDLVIEKVGAVDVDDDKEAKLLLLTDATTLDVTDLIHFKLFISMFSLLQNMKID
ncbi:hypothetical protein DFA_00061 [Cavenderia fasciculata]|uniref:Uncharacterized protein n=1 Tax=Cavenderia fasciculata TaxID=261658 RepID=F4PXH4_CACFS|nr:uncharacterized protein DFA_00061 [Cavenderia fasciculata]EGG19484.1 hypothetical protein DFA_00061 [Cavenderia fasciculata]|eukprot:XP_004357778.1 hypothetical protein DFA_00061 [Cavenderia fasciculata]